MKKKLYLVLTTVLLLGFTGYIQQSPPLNASSSTPETTTQHETTVFEPFLTGTTYPIECSEVAEPTQVAETPKATEGTEPTQPLTPTQNSGKQEIPKLHPFQTWKATQIPRLKRRIPGSKLQSAFSAPRPSRCLRWQAECPSGLPTGVYI